MAQDFTTTALLSSLKRRGMLPSTSETLSTSDFLAIATEELQTYVFKLLLATREEFAVASHDLSVVSGTAAYKLPSRAVGGKLRDVLLYDASHGGGYVSLQRIEPAMGLAGNGGIEGYYLQGDDVVFSPTPASSVTVRLTYFRRPSALVATTAAGAITAINTGTKVVTYTAGPAFSSTSALYDLVRGKPPFTVIGQDLAVTAANGSTTVTFTATLPTDLAVGDYVCLAGESPVAQVPVELHPLLSQRTVYKCLEALGDDKSVAAGEAADRMRLDAVTLLTPRVEGAARPIVNRYGPGFRRYRR